MQITHRHMKSMPKYLHISSKMINIFTFVCKDIRKEYNLNDANYRYLKSSGT
jgi:hypothetical protein